jgi:hypothetical protein
MLQEAYVQGVTSRPSLKMVDAFLRRQRKVADSQTSKASSTITNGNINQAG